MKKIQKLVAIIASLNCTVFGLCNNIYATESDVKNNSSTFDAKLVKEQFFFSAKKGLDEVVNNIVIDKSNADEIKFRYVAKLKKDEKLNDICLEYKVKDESLYEDVKYMLHSMITISISLMLDGNIILLPSLEGYGVHGVYMNPGYLSTLAKYSAYYDSLVNELISPYVELIINKIPKKQIN